MKPSNDTEAITLILQGLADKGWTCYMVQDDTYSNDTADNVRVSSIDEAVEVCTGVDEAFAYLLKGDDKAENGPSAWIYFVLGNEPEEVASNYTTNLDPDLDNIVQPWWE